MEPVFKKNLKTSYFANYFVLKSTLAWTMGMSKFVGLRGILDFVIVKPFWHSMNSIKLAKSLLEFNWVRQISKKFA